MVIISMIVTWMMSMRMRLVIMIISSSNMSEKDMKYNEKWCRQASCNSSTKVKAQYRGKKKASIFTMSPWCPRTCMPRTTPKRIQASGHLVKIHKEADLGGEEWRVEVGEGKKAVSYTHLTLPTKA